MKKAYLFLKRSVGLTAMAVITLTGYGSAGLAQTQLAEQETLQASGSITITTQEPARSAGGIPASSIQDAYILGPGDAVIVELLDVPEYSGVFTIGPAGTLYLPRLRSLVVEGLTVEELRNFLTQQFSAYVRDPQVFVSPAAYRPIRVYIGGEVARPGYYYLSGQQSALGAEAVDSTSPARSTRNRPGHGHYQFCNGGGSAHRRCRSTSPTTAHRLRCFTQRRWCDPVFQAE